MLSLVMLGVIVLLCCVTHINGVLLSVIIHIAIMLNAVAPRWWSWAKSCFDKQGSCFVSFWLAANVTGPTFLNVTISRKRVHVLLIQIYMFDKKQSDFAVQYNFEFECWLEATPDVNTKNKDM